MSIQFSDALQFGKCLELWASQERRPYVVAIDGRSGVGKSTLSSTIAEPLQASVIEGDDFFAGGIEIRSDSPAQRAADCIDWTRQRAVLHAVRQGENAAWRAFDWDAFDGRLRSMVTTLSPRPIIILEGVYAARPELADLIDCKVLVTLADEQREKRLLAREGTIGPWERQWHEAEAHYFQQIMPARRFEVIFEASDRTL